MPFLRRRKDYIVPFARPYLSDAEKFAVSAAVDSTWISDGPYLDQFEEDFARMRHLPDAVSVCNGTIALDAAIKGLGIKAGDEVIVPGFSFVAPFNMVLHAGARPVFCDVDPQTWCIDPAAAAALITPRTKAIIAVHLYGNVCDLDALKAMADRHNIFLIEDAAHAVLSSLNGAYTGTKGTLGCFSFQATKTITTGEGGMVTSTDKALLDRIRILRNHGMDPGKRYWHEVIGFNFRLTNIQAAIGVAQLKIKNEIVERKQHILMWYQDEFEGQEGVVLQHFASGVDAVIWGMGVRLDLKRFGLSRDEIMAKLNELGIDTRPGFFPPSAMPMYNAPALAVTDRLASEVIVLPAYTGMHAADVELVVKALLGLRKA